MLLQITNIANLYTAEYFYGVSLFVAGVVNLVLAGLLLFDSNNYLYAETPRYLRSRRLTAVSLAVFGVGFLLHWFFMPHFTNLLMGKALSFSYFHIGGVLFSMSHTGLIDRNYFNRQVVVRDVTLLCLSLIVYWVNAFVANTMLTYIGSALFFLHIGYLTWVFYSRFARIFKQLGNYADYIPNDTDREVLWLHASCHLIITFGIGGMLCTVLFHDATMPFTILLFVGIGVFTYIYKALDSFGVIASEAEGNLRKSEEYLQADEVQQDKQNNTLQHLIHAVAGHPASEPVIATGDIKTRVEKWVAARYFTNDSLTIRDTLTQMGITLDELNLYLEQHTTMRGYRQWLPYLRIEEAKRLMLQKPNYSFEAIALECGYANRSTFSRSFKAQEGVSPMDWLNMQRRRRRR